MRHLAVAVALILSLCPLASATQISFESHGFGTDVTVNFASNSESGFAGEIKWGWIGISPSGYDATFYSYSLDMFHHLSGAQDVAIRSTNYLTVSGVQDAGAKAAWLFNTYEPGIRKAGNGDADAAALQVAIWEAIYDQQSEDTLSSGSFLSTGTFTMASSAIATRATQYLTALYTNGGPNGYTTSTTNWLDTDVMNGSGQDQIIQMPVPEPASLLLCATGLIALARARARRKRR